MINPDPISLIFFNPKGFTVSGSHSPSGLPVHPDIEKAFEDNHKQWLEKISGGLGFDGDRAAITGYQYSPGHLHLSTAYRTYTEGRAMRDAIYAQPKRRSNTPEASLSWGMSLTAYVLMPYGHILCSQRSKTLAVAPGIWTAAHTEVMEPGDVDSASMAPLLARLVDEEIPALSGIGTHKFVGLGLRQRSYTWQLIAVLDLRDVPMAEVLARLELLHASAETDAWAARAAYPVRHIAAAQSEFYPEKLRYTASVVPEDMSIAQELNDKVQK